MRIIRLASVQIPILSSPFSVNNGVRLGEVLPTVLFSVYIDKLLQHLQKLGVGCHWEGMFVDGLFMQMLLMRSEGCFKSVWILLLRKT